MAWLFGDSFDFYSLAADMLGGPAPLWLTASNCSLAAGRFPGSRGPVGGSLGGVISGRIWSSNETTVFAIVAVKSTLAQPAGFSLFDGATAQCSVTFETNGSITHRRGLTTGTTVATYPGALVANIWTHFQFKMTIDNAAGSFTVRKDGATSDSFAASGFDNQNTANNYANSIQVLLSTAGGAPVPTWDDLLVFSDNGAAPNTWVGDVRAVQQMVASDPVSPTFARSPDPILLGPSVSTGTTFTHLANSIHQTQITPTHEGRIAKLTINLSSPLTGHITAGIYSGINLVQQASVLTNPGAGFNDFIFSPPVALAKVTYGIVLHADAAFALVSTANWIPSNAMNLTYTGTLPATVSLITSTLNGIFYATEIPFSYGMLNEATQDGDSSYIYDSNVGDEDDFGIAPLATAPLAIIGAVGKMFVRKSDAGSRSGDLYLRSGASNINVGSGPLSTTAGFLSLLAPADPNTGAAWTASGINALTLGPKVTV